MRILRNYILKEFLSSSAVTLFVMMFVMLIGRLVQLAELIIAKGVPILMVAKLFLFFIPFILSFVIPVAILSGTLLALGRLSSDNELIAIRASGISILKILSPIIVVGILASLFCIILNNRLIPDAHHKMREVQMEIGSHNPTAMLEAGTFITGFDKFIIFIYHIDGNKFNNIRIYEPQGEGKPPRTIIAKKGEFILLPEKQLLKLKLIDGTSDEINPQDPENFYKLNFKTYFMNIDFKKQQNSKVEKKAKDMTLNELRIQLAAFKKQNIDTNPIATEIYKRISLAFSCLIFILIGAPLGIITRRREKSINASLAFVIVTLYYLAFIGCEAMSIEGFLPPSVAMSIPNTIFGTIGLFLTTKTCLS